MFFSDSNIEVFAVFNKVFVVLFFRNIALLSFSSAKALNFAVLFWYIRPVCNQFDIFSSFCAEESICHAKKQGLLFFLFAPIMRKKHEAVRRFLHLIFSILLLFLYFLRLLQKEPFMSTERFDIRHAPAPRESFRCCTSARADSAATGTARSTPIPARNCSTASAARGSFCSAGSCSRSNRMIWSSSTRRWSTPS